MDDGFGHSDEAAMRIRLDTTCQQRIGKPLVFSEKNTFLSNKLPTSFMMQILASLLKILEILFKTLNRRANLLYPRAYGSARDTARTRHCKVTCTNPPTIQPNHAAMFAASNIAIYSIPLTLTAFFFRKRARLLDQLQQSEAFEIYPTLNVFLLLI